MTSSTADKYTTTEYGKQNMFGAEVAPWVDENDNYEGCLLYTSPSPRDRTRSRMPSSA